MSRRDYEAVAAALREQVDAWPSNGGEVVEIIRAVLANTAEGLADAFEEDNERFDRERFLSACGVEV
jgi:hypothetical protein